ncbi:hypothetical protein BDW74DRAFT_175156 [Aspergillus multicolor]|uniref:uncharacterized protein n=1 Tax=Aspergillus multicolor TaxID=41759 RepID=UPI003CCD0891
MFSTAHLPGMIHDDERLKDIVSLVGGVYAAQNPHLLETSKPDKSRLFQRLNVCRTTITADLESAPGQEALGVILTRAILLSFAELMVDPSGGKWDLLVRQMQGFTRIHGAASGDHGHGVHGRLPRSTLTLLRILSSSRALVQEEDPGIIPQTLARPIPLVDTDIAGLSQNDLLERFAEHLETWAQLQAWIRMWEADVEDSAAPAPAHSPQPQSQPSPSLSAQEIRGLELTCIGAQFQRQILSCLTFYASSQASSSTTANFTSAMLAFYHCISIDISRLFAGPAWLRLDCELPVMPQRLSYEQATRALECAERSMESLHLEAILYGPILYVVSMEMARKVDRQRMVRFMGMLRKRGFGVIERFRAEIEQDWG